MAKPNRSLELVRLLHKQRIKAKDGEGYEPLFGDVHLHDPKAPMPGVLPTGVATLDLAIGVGGYPEGRTTILHGGEASGKTTLALLAVRECQRLGGVAMYCDLEHKLDLRYAVALGVNVDTMILSTPPYIERGMQLVEKAVLAARQLDPTTPVLIVWDSLQAADAKKSYEVELEDNTWGPEAQAYSRCLRRVNAAVSDSRAVFLMISQVRMQSDGYASKERIGVGRAPLFYASVVITLKANRKDGDVRASARTGEQVKATVRKNQVGVPFKVAEYTTVYGKGIDEVQATLQAAELLGLLTRAGSWYCLGDERLFNGKAGATEWAAKHPKQYELLCAAMREQIAKGKALEVAPAAAPEEAKELDSLEE